MSEKVIVKFVRSHGRYIKGDIAGFDAVTAKKLTAGDAAPARPYDPEAEKKIAAAPDDIAALSAREAALEARAAALAEREAALAADGAEGKAAGAPPKQGAK
ncbi:hypothetical protein SAMN05444722_1692 [Rhodovulum sp. ES.010]|uniref:hypothetical protein n=1 Tax=Rhodovulum sp. ES.010 TaxID=1882821 RepID=UPI00092C9DD5|nr:hypothetical protein [Rhodovulum sp. ES.010]SIO36555.1 hypothetical protein SAMN05444722_1692 [Rhodovulum sp. ES.010]